MTRAPTGRAVLVCAALLFVTAGPVALAAWQDSARAQSVAPTLTVIDVRTLAGVATLLVAALLSLLYFYRRRVYILCWMGGWIPARRDRCCSPRATSDATLGGMAYGISQFLGDGQRARLRRQRRRLPARDRSCAASYALVLLPVLIWFALAPLALGPAAVFAPGHLLIAGALPAAGAAHLLLLRQARLLGAAVVGAALLRCAASNVCWATSIAAQSERTVDRRRPS